MGVLSTLAIQSTDIPNTVICSYQCVEYVPKINLIDKLNIDLHTNQHINTLLLEARHKIVRINAHQKIIHINGNS